MNSSDNHQTALNFLMPTSWKSLLRATICTDKNTPFLASRCSQAKLMASLIIIMSPNKHQMLRQTVRLTSSWQACHTVGCEKDNAFISVS